MKILIVAATNTEIEPIVKQLIKSKCSLVSDKKIIYNTLNIDILITGIGLVFTAYHLAKTLSGEKYDLVINIGIAGSFNKNIQIGEVVQVIQEEFSDLGIESPSEFKTIFESGFIDKNEIPFTNGKLLSNHLKFRQIESLKQVKSISSNTAHGNELTIKAICKKFNPDIESMEGAAFFYVCLMEKVSFLEIRAISNYVESRDKSKWNIPLALDNLSNYIFQLIKQIDSSIS